MTRITEFLLGFETDREGLDSPVTVGTTSTRLVPQNPNRLFLTFINPSTNTVYVDTQTSVAVDEGFIISSNDGVLQFETRTDGDVTTEEFHAVADGGTANIIVRAEQAVGQIPEPSSSEAS